jgi:hypothetical protein
VIQEVRAAPGLGVKLARLNSKLSHVWEGCGTHSNACIQRCPIFVVYSTVRYHTSERALSLPVLYSTEYSIVQSIVQNCTLLRSVYCSCVQYYRYLYIRNSNCRPDSSRSLDSASSLYSTSTEYSLHNVRYFKPVVGCCILYLSCAASFIVANCRQLLLSTCQPTKATLCRDNCVVPRTTGTVLFPNRRNVCCNCNLLLAVRLDEEEQD